MDSCRLLSSGHFALGRCGDASLCSFIRWGSLWSVSVAHALCVLPSLLWCVPWLLRWFLLGFLWLWAVLVGLTLLFGMLAPLLWFIRSARSVGVGRLRLVRLPWCVRSLVLLGVVLLALFPRPVPLCSFLLVPRLLALLGSVRVLGLLWLLLLGWVFLWWFFGVVLVRLSCPLGLVGLGFASARAFGLVRFGGRPWATCSGSDWTPQQSKKR